MLKVKNLRKEYDSVTAVDGVSLEVKRGELFGLLGPNGAGKTTTIRTILNILQPDGGEITFEGRPFTEDMWNRIGYLPEERGLYRKSRIINAIQYFASLKGIPSKQSRPRAYYWLERFGLKNEGRRRIEELSKGNQQKIQLIISILHDPELLILDEPFTGLDPVNQVLMKDILLEIRQKNTAIIFSTHQMEQVEKMCDNICLINKGKPVLSGELREIKKRYGTNSVHIEFEGDGEFLKKNDLIRRADIYQNYAELELTDISRSRELLTDLNERLALRKFEIVEPSLNSIFIHVIGGLEIRDQVFGGEKPNGEPDSGSNNNPASADRRKIRSLLFSMSMIAFTVVYVAFFFEESGAKLPVVMLLTTASVFGILRYLRVRREIRREMESKRMREHTHEV
jgi:ABC-2 type transport system ATP-binding protein